MTTEAKGTEEMASETREALEEEVLSEVVRILTDLLGEDLMSETHVTRQTRFSEDLQLESIEFVSLAEDLQKRYGTRVDFVAFLGGLDLDSLLTVDVGALVAFVADSLLAVPAAASTAGEDRA